MSCRQSKLRSGKRLVQASVTEHKSELLLQFPKDAVELREEVKVMRGASFRHEPFPHWAVKDCERNRIQLELLQDSLPVELERYFRPQTVSWQPRRECLFPWQEEMVRHVLAKRCVVLAAEMGVGKTLAVIEVLEHLDTDCWWVTCSGIIPATELEFEQWEAECSPRFFSYAGFREFVQHDWDGTAPQVLVFDESTMGGLKTTGKTFKAAFKVAETIRQAGGYVVLLSGTPAPHSPLDWWPQLEIVQPGFLREGTLGAFTRRLAQLEGAQVGTTTFQKISGWKEDELKGLARRLEPLVYTCFVRQVQELPEPTHHIVELEPSQETLQAAWHAVQQSETVAIALGRLRQLSDGFLYGRNGEALRSGDQAKAEALRQILRDHSDDKRIVIYAGFRASVDLCAEVCAQEGWAVICRDGRGYRTPRGLSAKDCLRQLNRKTDTGVIERLAYVAHPLSGGVGLNLTAAPAAVFFSSDFAFGARAQAMKRIHRTGCGPSVTFYDLVHLPTDKKILRSFQEKRYRQALTLEDALTLEELKDALGEAK